MLQLNGKVSFLLGAQQILAVCVCVYKKSHLKFWQCARGVLMSRRRGASTQIIIKNVCEFNFCD